MDVLNRLFDSVARSPHGFCPTCDPGLLRLEAASDALIAMAFFSIPLSLVRLARGRVNRSTAPVVALLAAFAVACGSTHMMSMLILWVPAYRADGLLKLLAATLSVATAATLWPLVPRVRALPSRSAMTALNDELRARVGEQERIAAELRENQTRLLLAQEAGQVGTWDLDLRGGPLRWSESQFALYGLPPGDAAPSREAWLEQLDALDRDRVEAALQAASEAGGGYVAEFRIRLPDGGIRWLAERGRVVSDGRSQRMVGVSADVTERIRLTVRLTESNQLLSASAAEHAHARRLAAEQMKVMFDHSPDAMFVLRVERDVAAACAEEFVFEAINPSTTRLSGRPAEDFVERRPQECHAPDEAAGLLEQYRRCLASGAVTTFAASRMVAGRKREFETALAPVRDPRSGQVDRIIGVARDVTERIEMELQMRQLAKIDATHRLPAGIAHDFNNMLQALMGGLEMLQLELQDPSQREYAEVALQAARRGAELTHRLLAFSRQQSLQPRSVDAGKLLEGVAGLVARSLGPQVRLAVTQPPAQVLAMADPGQLEAAIISLVVNAAEAMPQGGRIQIAASRAMAEPGPAAGLVLAAGEHAVLSISDDGEGMAPDVLQQCCEPFFTTRGLNGSGLGLSMVQGFARQSGGDLRIESAPGRGTRMEIWLPLAASPAAPEACEPAHVLLVDDAPDVLVTLGAFLGHAGLQVTRAATGREALAHLAQGVRCDVLVTDYAMPEVNGLELLRAARELRPRLPALLITGVDQTAMAAGPDGARMLQKPFGRCTLVDEVRSLLAPASMQDEPPARRRQLSDASVR